MLIVVIQKTTIFVHEDYRILHQEKSYNEMQSYEIIDTFYIAIEYTF